MANNSINNKFRGTGGDDAFYQWINDTDSYAQGIDTSDTNSLKITYGGTDPSSGSIYQRVDSTGYITQPFQPVYNGRLANPVANVTGDGTNYKPVNWTTFINTGGYFDDVAGEFTTPVAGAYLVIFACTVGNMTNLHTTGYARINAGNRVYNGNKINPFAVRTGGGQVTGLQVSAICRIAAGLIISPRVLVSGGALQVSIGGGAFNNMDTHLSISLLY